MSLPIRIKDGEGNGRHAGVTGDHALKVTNTTASARDISAEELTRRKVFIEFLRNTSDSRDMHLADGSTTPAEFVLEATSGSVRWIDFLRIIIEGNNFDLSASGDFRRWGQIATAPGLTNGTKLHVEQGGITTDLFYDPVRNMGDLFYYQTGYENFVNAVDSQADFLAIDIAMPETVALPLGVNDRIVATVQDDLVNADFLKFQILARGYTEVV